MFGYRHEEIINEKFMMFVIQTLRPFQHAPFELFIDFTHTGTENRFRFVIFCLRRRQSVLKISFFFFFTAKLMSELQNDLFEKLGLLSKYQ